jgi:hypothetical protein
MKVIYIYVEQDGYRRQLVLKTNKDTKGKRFKIEDRLLTDCEQR